jgi:hypothetical protein
LGSLSFKFGKLISLPERKGLYNNLKNPYPLIATKSIIFVNCSNWDGFYKKARYQKWLKMEDDSKRMEK